MILFTVKFMWNGERIGYVGKGLVQVDLPEFNFFDIQKAVEEDCKTGGVSLSHMYEISDEHGNQYRTDRKPHECPRCFGKLKRTLLRKERSQEAPGDKNRHYETHHEKCECGWERTYGTETIGVGWKEMTS